LAGRRGRAAGVRFAGGGVIRGSRLTFEEIVELDAARCGTAGPCVRRNGPGVRRMAFVVAARDP